MDALSKRLVKDKPPVAQPPVGGEAANPITLYVLEIGWEAWTRTRIIRSRI